MRIQVQMVGDSHSKDYYTVELAAALIVWKMDFVYNNEERIFTIDDTFKDDILFIVSAEVSKPELYTIL